MRSVPNGTCLFLLARSSIARCGGMVPMLFMLGLLSRVLVSALSVVAVFTPPSFGCLTCVLYV